MSFLKIIGAFLFLTFSNASYLFNNKSYINYTDIPTTTFSNTNNLYPSVAFGCSLADDSGNLYLVSSTYQFSNVNYLNQQQKCTRSTKNVEVLKYNKETNNFSGSLLIGQKNQQYPNAIGGPGGDNIISCGYDKISNILYYISSNNYNCESSHNLDSSIVRINTTNFNYIDRTLLKNIANIPKFSENSYYDYKYIHAPSSSIVIDGDSIWISFGTYSTGVWRLNITSPDIILLDSYQKKITVQMSEMTGSGTTNTYDRYVKDLKYSFTGFNSKMIYFVEDTGWEDSRILEINTSLPLNNNNTKVYKLDGISHISSITINQESQKIYIVSGSLTSELYQYDFNFNKLKLNDNCNVDFLKFPTDWGVISGMEIDYKTGFLYPIISNRYEYSGIARIDMKDLSMDLTAYQKFKEPYYITSNNKKYNYLRYLNKYNISHIDLDIGKIYLVPCNGGSNVKKIIEIELYGCSKGRGVYHSSCKTCLIGEFSDVVGGVCEKCEKGYASPHIYSHKCDKCERGKYGDGVNTVFCQDCLAGQYSENTGSYDCLLCPEGKFSIISPSSSLKNCKECEKGKISVKGSVSCNFCEMGKWTQNKIKCVECPKGKYSDTIGIINTDDCKLCLIGFYSQNTGLINQNQCEECPSGRIGIIDGAVSNITCKICDVGKFKANVDTCEQCPSGRISNGVQCFTCFKGRYSDNYQLNCELCPMGKYIDFEGGSSENDCISCVKGRFSNISGAVSDVSCHPCYPGKYNINSASISSDSCKNCEAGKFNKDHGNDKCSDCPFGYFSYIKSVKCEICEKGKYSLNDGENKFTDCLKCPQGTYSDFEGAKSLESCISCPAGTWQNEYGSQNKDRCKKCLEGLYSETIKAVNIETCIECEAGKFSKYKGADTEDDCLYCETGKFSNVGSRLCEECSIGKYSSIMGTISCIECEQGKYAGKKSSIVCDNCDNNQETSKDKSKCECIKGSYLLNNTCINCPNEFICNKKSTIQTIILKKNYWRENNNTIEIYKCRNIFSCKGGIIVNYTDEICHEGHSGPLCDICLEGWSKDDGVCLKCPENMERTLSLTIVIPVVCILIIIFLIKTANPSNNKKEEVNGVVKIFMNYAQVFSLASSFQINWPTLIRYLFERAKEFSSPRVSFYSSDCVIGWSYYDKLIVYLTLPLLYIVVVTIVISILSWLFTRRKSNKLKKFKTIEERNTYKLTHPNCLQFFIAWEKTAIVVGTFLSWPTIVEKTLEVMNCEKIGQNYYLIKDMSVLCYTSKHYIFLIVAYIALGVYGIGIPYMGFRLLYKYRYRLFDMQDRYDGSTPLSFLYLGYREKRWYYEFIIMGKKAGLILLSVFLRNHPRYQIIGASLLVQISFFLHVFLKPYDTITSYGLICNKLESISLLSLVMTLSTGLFFGTIDSGYQLGFFEDVLIVLLILSNGGVTLYFFIYFITLTWKTMKTHLREHLQKKFDDDELPFCLKCCGKSKVEYIKEWSFLELTDNYGIYLKTDLERHIFTNYFSEKQTKLSILNSKIDSIGKKKLSIKLDKLRSEIQVMEKQRCWQTIQNNRLYSTLKKIAMIHKSKLCDGELEKLEEVFNLYMSHGIEYNKKMNNLYMKELEGMIENKQKISYENKTEYKIKDEEKLEKEKNTVTIQMENIIIVHEDEMESHIII